jgi:RNA polymerase sigma factor (sigma-70 family)
MPVEPWRTRLADGDADGAWALFIDRYRALIVATIRRTIEDDESALEAFAEVCGTLSANELERLRRYHDTREPKARFSTWLVTVVRNLVVDWLRKRDGRKRVKTPPDLSGVQREIFRCVFAEQHSHIEAYERVCAATPEKLSFGSFLKELSETYRVVQRTRAGGVMHYLAGVPSLAETADGDAHDALARTDALDRLGSVIGSLAPDDRLALQLSVIDQLPAADVARTVGWPNAKAVYNRVYRLLARLRHACEQQGIRLVDL